MKLTVSGTLVVLLTWAGYAMTWGAEWKLVESAPPKHLGHGATLVVKKVAGPGGSAELTLVLFSESACTIKVAANTSKADAKSLEQMAQAGGAMAACNGGYFEPPKMLPTGLEISGGTRTGSLDRSLPFGGLLTVRQDKAAIFRDDEFLDANDITALIQCCPRLIENGKLISGIGGETGAPRTFIMTDGAGWWAIGICKSATLPDLAAMLGTPQIISEFKVQRALNLDGGPSMSLWSSDVSGVVSYIREGWRVRNAILVVPRTVPSGTERVPPNLILDP